MRDYGAFGIRKIWLQDFFKAPERWLSGENSCGPIQFEAMKKWLNDAELIRREKKGYRVTELAELLSHLGADDLFVWGVIWVNLARNSSLISWYVNELEWGKYYKREQIIELMGNNLGLATRKNALQSLIELFKHTPLGEKLGLGVPEKVGRKVTAIVKRGLSNELTREDLSGLLIYLLLKFEYINDLDGISLNNRINYLGCYRVLGLGEESFTTASLEAERFTKMISQVNNLEDIFRLKTKYAGDL